MHNHVDSVAGPGQVLSCDSYHVGYQTSVQLMLCDFLSGKSLFIDPRALVQADRPIIALCSK